MKNNKLTVYLSKNDSLFYPVSARFKFDGEEEKVYVFESVSEVQSYFSQKYFPITIEYKF